MNIYQEQAMAVGKPQERAQLHCNSFNNNESFKGANVPSLAHYKQHAQLKDLKANDWNNKREEVISP